MTVRSYGPTAQAVTPASLSEVSVRYMDGTTPTFTTAVAIDGQGRVSFALDDGGTVKHLLVKVANSHGTSSARVTLGPDGSAPTAVAGPAAGTSPSAITVSGRDDDATVSLTTGTSTAAGKLCTVTFAQAKAKAPDGIIAGAGGDNSSAAGLEVRNVTATGFEVWVRNAPTASTSFVFSYDYVPRSAGDIRK